jgi:uncharacterized protein (TIGR04255 family)
MSVTYKNAPLVELVAEVRWGSVLPAVAPGQPPFPQFTFPKAKDEELFMHFGALAAAMGYARFERLLPPAFPIPPNQVACRFRPTDTDRQSPILQLGPSIFSANALPPYKSWFEFSPIVRTGIDTLLEAHQRAGLSAPRFNTAVVRYIDAFRENLTGGRSVQLFLQEIMGINLTLPKAITSKATDPAAIQPMLKLTVPTALGLFEIAAAEGHHGNDKAILLDMSVLVQREFAIGAEEIMAALTDARQLIHDTFRGLTQPLHSAMEPS